MESFAGRSIPLNENMLFFALADGEGLFVTMRYQVIFIGDGLLIDFDSALLNESFGVASARTEPGVYQQLHDGGVLP